MIEPSIPRTPLVKRARTDARTHAASRDDGQRALHRRVCSLQLGFAGDVDSIAIGSWQWSCKESCTKATECSLARGMAESHRASSLVIVMSPCCSDPCPLKDNGFCEVDTSCTSGDILPCCTAGDYTDCKTVVPVLGGTLPDAIGRLTCRLYITIMYTACRRAAWLPEPAPLTVLAAGTSRTRAWWAPCPPASPA